MNKKYSMKNPSKVISQRSKSWKLLPPKVKNIDKNHLHMKDKCQGISKNYLGFKKNLKERNPNHLITRIRSKVISNFPSRTIPSKIRFMNLSEKTLNYNEWTKKWESNYSPTRINTKMILVTGWVTIWKLLWRVVEIRTKFWRKINQN